MTTVEEHVVTSPSHIGELGRVRHLGRRQRPARLHILTKAKRRDVLIAWTSEYSASASGPAGGGAVGGGAVGADTGVVPTSDSAAASTS